MNGCDKKISFMLLHYKCGDTKNAKFKTLQPFGISRIFVYWVVKLLENIEGIEDRPKSVTVKPQIVYTSQAVKAEKTRCQRNPLRKQNIMS